MKIILTALVLSMSFNNFAQDQLPSWNKVMDKCFQEITPKTKCPISEREALFQTQKDINYWTLQMNKEFLDFDKKCLDKKKTTAGKTIRNRMISRLKTEVNSKGFSPCQKACVANCIASKFIEPEKFYGTNPSLNHGKMHNLFEVYSIQVGECTEFSRINNDLLESLGFETKVSAVGPREDTPGHAFTTVKVNGTWYHMNTPISECLFYRTKPAGNKETEPNWINHSPGVTKGVNYKSDQSGYGAREN